jgi:hypothetical protein
MMSRADAPVVATRTLVAADRPTTGVVAPGAGVADERPVRHVRHLRATAWAVGRALRDPRRVPGTWRSPGFAARVDRVRAQLLPIPSLSSLADSFTREHGLDDDAVRVAYGLRWLELSGQVDERPWRLVCTPPPR